MRAIDLYSGVGGWSLGLKMAGIQVVDSYEYWAPANETNFRNNGHHANLVDIRTLELDRLPEDVDFVVGSPPCTQFSFSNRGGNGDIADGLIDIVKFLTIVDHLKPRFWAMENVPRVANVIRRELRLGGVLEKFAHLEFDLKIINMEEFGLPQRRKRCLVGKLDFGLLASYASVTSRPNLGEVVRALAAPNVIDPIYGIPVTVLHDHLVEDFLNGEEQRLNKSAKTMHPVYNSMPFPDSLDRSVRTITATCTRVSRESVVIPDVVSIGEYRRLTIRERASLQGFPASFQFYGDSYRQKLMMIGNAVPPLFSYYVGQALRGVPVKEVASPEQGIALFYPPSVPPPATSPERWGLKYPPHRTFRMAIPALRLKSGVRFELGNYLRGRNTCWAVSFFFGTSTDIQKLQLDTGTFQMLRHGLPPVARDKVLATLDKLSDWLASTDWNGLQRIWSHRGPGATHPFVLLDTLDDAGCVLVSALRAEEEGMRSLLTAVLEHQLGGGWIKIAGVAKLLRNASTIVAGLLVGSLTNSASIKAQSPALVRTAK